MSEHEPEITPEQDDDRRYAPPDDTADAEAEAVPDAAVGVEAESVLSETGDDDPAAAASDADDHLDLDIDAALAAVASLDDVLAEQEAEEQAEIARQQAEAEAQARRRARVQNPEMFFPMPPMGGLQRGRMDSVVPALVLIALGAWLTLTLTTTRALPETRLLIPVVCAALAVVLLARWLVSGRWSRGTLLIGLTALFVGVMFALLDMVIYWPLLIATPGFAFILTALLAQPTPDSRLMLPGLTTIVAALVALAVVNGAVPQPVLDLAAAWWPVLVAALVVILFVPRLLNRR